MIAIMPADALRLYMYILASIGLLRHDRILVIADHLLAMRLNIDIESAYQYLIDKKLIKRSVKNQKSYIIALCSLPRGSEKKKLEQLCHAQPE